MLCDKAKVALGLSNRKPISNHLNSALIEIPSYRPRSGIRELYLFY
jgi:hypothetical protein